jgi:hypothetical protein
MTDRRRSICSPSIDCRAGLAALLLALASLAGVLAAPARASSGYELDPVTPSHTVGGAPRGIAVDQASHDIYVAIVSKNPSIGSSGEIERFHSNLTAFGTFGSGYYTGVAINPLTHDFYGSRVRIELSIGSVGTPGLDRFSSSGTATGTFAIDDTEGLPPMAADSAGNLYYPNAAEHAVLVFDANGVLQEELTCGGCPGGSFGKPWSVAMGAGDALYVADLAPDRVVKLVPSGGTYAFSSLIQSGRGATAVGVDPASGDVLVGDMPGGANYHIVAYDSSGTQFDDFGAELFPEPGGGFGVFGAYQMAVDASNHKLYVGENEAFYVFDKTTIDPPTASIQAPSNIGQLTASLNASVNANGHAVLSCTFELTTEADVGFASAKSSPCSENPDGSAATAVKANVSGLSAASSYRYRVTATSNAGPTTSGAEVFETLPAVLPTVTTEPPTSVTETSATIKGAVNPHGGSSSNCHFDFGTSLSYGTTFSCLTLPGPATTDVVVTRKISTLTPATTYHYRLVVTTNAGTDEGNDVEFTTASPPSDPGSGGAGSTPAPSSPPPTTVPPPSSGPITTPHPLHCRKGFRKKRVHGKVRCVKRKHRHRRHS